MLPQAAQQGHWCDEEHVGARQHAGVQGPHCFFIFLFSCFSFFFMAFFFIMCFCFFFFSIRISKQTVSATSSWQSIFSTPRMSPARAPHLFLARRRQHRRQHGCGSLRQNWLAQAGSIRRRTGPSWPKLAHTGPSWPKLAGPSWPKLAQTEENAATAITSMTSRLHSTNDALNKAGVLEYRHMVRREQLAKAIAEGPVLRKPWIVGYFFIFFWIS